jgi:CRISPR-associated protein Csd2
MTTHANGTGPVDRRFDFVFLFDVADGNPNGDPDAGNLPRIDPQSLQGLITDGCLKRKVRNAVAVMKQEGADAMPGYDLYFQTQDAVYDRRVLNLQHQRAYTALGLGAGDKKKDGKEKDAKILADNTARARKWMCQNFYDIRAFGAVMTTGVNCG